LSRQSAAAAEQRGPAPGLNGGQILNILIPIEAWLQVNSL
jgi:hypothetical protein